jgi:hypothetical protein
VVFGLYSAAFSSFSHNFNPTRIPKPCRFRDHCAKFAFGHFGVEPLPQLSVLMHRETFLSFLPHHVHDLFRTVFGLFCFLDVDTIHFI